MPGGGDGSKEDGTDGGGGEGDGGGGEGEVVDGLLLGDVEKQVGIDLLVMELASPG
jgi:hypothetical protein